MSKFFKDKSLDFKPTQEYLDSMPDLSTGRIKGAHVPIQNVGISGFKIPVKIKTREGSSYDIDFDVTGTVSLEAEKKGINMSRILRTFYNESETTSVFDIDALCNVLKSYKKDLDTFSAQILISFDYRLWQKSLRSVNDFGVHNGGWQYYKVIIDCSINETNEVTKVIHFDFVYSSACPCSTDLSLHAEETRGLRGIPHSQRSVARVSVQFEEFVWIEDIHDICLKALKTETLVFCKREDEQAFAELNFGQDENGNPQNTKFVEDAVRLLYEQLDKYDKIKDFKVVCSHNESLHSHNAIGVITKGIDNSIFTKNVSIYELKTLVY